MVQVDVMVRGIVSWHTKVSLVPNEQRLNTETYLSVVADHVHPYSLLTAFSRITNHVTKLKSSQTAF